VSWHSHGHRLPSPVPFLFAALAVPRAGVYNFSPSEDHGHAPKCPESRGIDVFSRSVGALFVCRLRSARLTCRIGANYD
jgi:hypothetical protein